ncbi:expressed unknown protein [Seminavis robusta]|uniref:Uncharacterized protein n=1 Tax=Seminavis robusta TaxID=568900 RepID=A0A9N8HW07_9STRA|nr:expressed unknown protein [Seminavis robusta]|eukprot:Sro2102_g314610.1 n/a (229) ;mRNA; f:7583-8269
MFTEAAKIIHHVYDFLSLLHPMTPLLDGGQRPAILGIASSDFCSNTSGAANVLDTVVAGAGVILLAIVLFKKHGFEPPLHHIFMCLGLAAGTVGHLLRDHHWLALGVNGYLMGSFFILSGGNLPLFVSLVGPGMQVLGRLKFDELEHACFIYAFSAIGFAVTKRQLFRWDILWMIGAYVTLRLDIYICYWMPFSMGAHWLSHLFFNFGIPSLVDLADEMHGGIQKLLL